MKMRKSFIGVVFLVAQLFMSAQSWAIKKCQDADGKWHYGDVAVVECENSKITTLNNRGVITDQEEAPKNKEQLWYEQRAAEIAKQAADKKKKREDERLRILSIYESENDIDRQRDNQINSVQGNIDVHKAYLKSMTTRVERYQIKQSETTVQRVREKYQTLIAEAELRIATSEKELEGLLGDKEAIMERFAREKEVYVSIKGEQENKKENEL